MSAIHCPTCPTSAEWISRIDRKTLLPFPRPTGDPRRHFTRGDPYAGLRAFIARVKEARATEAEKARRDEGKDLSLEPFCHPGNKVVHVYQMITSIPRYPPAVMGPAIGSTVYSLDPVWFSNPLPSRRTMQARTETQLGTMDDSRLGPLSRGGCRCGCMGEKEIKPSDR